MVLWCFRYGCNDSWEYLYQLLNHFLFSVYVVAAFTDGVTNPFSSSLKDSLIIALKFRILLCINATRDIFNCVGGLSFTSSHDMILHWLFADFSLASFKMLLLRLVSLLMGEVLYLMQPPSLFLSTLVQS